VVEHRLERAAGAGLQAARQRAEAGAEEATDVGGHVRDPDLRLWAAPVFCTDLHTLGELGQKDGIEGARRERMLDIVLQSADRHARRALDPGGVEGLRAGGQHEGDENLRLRRGDATRAPRLAEGRRQGAGALQPEQGTRLARRHGEPLARVAVEAPEAEPEGGARSDEGEQERADPGEQALLQRGRSAQARIELTRLRVLEAGDERLDEGRGLGRHSGCRRGPGDELGIGRA
jgi:hypothetical protein